MRAPVVTEQMFQAAVVEAATMLGWHHLHVRRSIGKGSRWTTATNIAGWPDLLLWRPGRIVAAELKTTTGTVTPEQHAVLVSLAEAGVETCVWRPTDWNDISDVLNPRAVT